MVISFIRLLLDLLALVVIVDVLLGYVLDPFHPVKASLDRIVAPMLGPIRRMIPTVNMIDFSPLVLIILIQVVDFILVQIA
jgi:YggT family protein